MARNLAASGDAGSGATGDQGATAWQPAPVLPGTCVTVMGLGLHGGGIESARYLCSLGADVTVTDLRSEEILRPSMDALAGLPIRYVLGEHRVEDFENADLVIKNPAIKRDNKFLLAARRVSTDIALFLDAWKGPVFAVTGSKGKSSTASALAFGLRELDPRTRLGGNITVSPLGFLTEPGTDAPVVLELSSFQLGDLAWLGRPLGAKGAILTNILHDHQDYYSSMDDYAADKLWLFSGSGGTAVLQADQSTWTSRLESELSTSSWRVWNIVPEPVAAGGTAASSAASRSTPTSATAWLEQSPEGLVGVLRGADGSRIEIVPARTTVIGLHQKYNLLSAGVLLYEQGLDPQRICEALAAYPGIPHRMELVSSAGGVRVYNDSAATIPDALIAALESFDSGERIHLICGGTDKNLDFSRLATAARRATTVAVLAGTAQQKICAALEAGGIAWTGPHDNLQAACQAAFEAAEPGDCVVFSPGCASFGMFLNEFDRGTKFRNLVQSTK